MALAYLESLKRHRDFDAFLFMIGNARSLKFCQKGTGLCFKSLPAFMVDQNLIPAASQLAKNRIPHFQ
jgi:hypothetical protein